MCEKRKSQNGYHAGVNITSLVFLIAGKTLYCRDIIIFMTYPVTPVVTPLILSIVWLLPILLPSAQCPVPTIQQKIIKSWKRPLQLSVLRSSPVTMKLCVRGSALCSTSLLSLFLINSS